jgi:hypothetical protein
MRHISSICTPSITDMTFHPTSTKFISLVRAFRRQQSRSHLCEKSPAFPFDELSYPANPVLEFWFVLHPYQTGCDHGVVHADGYIRYLLTMFAPPRYVQPLPLFNVNLLGL